MPGECDALGEEVTQLKQSGADAETERDAALASIARLEAELLDITATKSGLEYASPPSLASNGKAPDGGMHACHKCFIWQCE